MRFKSGLLTITPDGNFVDFVAIEIEAGSSDLWRVPLLGGPARRLVRDVWSATGWSPDGRFMAFVRSKGWDKDSSVIVVDSAGENERIVATRHSPQSFLSAAVSAVYANRPSWSPDGTTIVLAGFSQRGGDSGPTESELVMLDAVTGSVQRVELGGKSLIEVAWLDHDRLLVNGGHTWMPTLFTSDRLAADWRPMTQEFALFAIPTLTQDRSTLAVTRFERRSAVWVLEQSGTSLTVAVPEAAWGAGRPVLTRSGSLFYSVMTGTGLYAIHRRDNATPQPSIVAKDLQFPGSFVVAPDEQSVIFISGKPPYPLVRVSRDGSVVELVRTNASGPAITKDNQVLFSPIGTPGLYSVPLTGGAPRKLWSGSVGNEPSISPDGTQVLFAGATPSTVVRCDLPDCTNVKEFQLRSSVRAPDGQGSVWAPDGQGVAYINEDDGGNIWEQPFDGRVHRPLTKIENASILEFSWSPDGQRLVMARGKMWSDMVLMKGLSVTRPR